MSEKELQQPDETKGKLVTPTPKKIDLHSSNAIRRELASVYRDMRTGKLEAATGTKLAYVLELLRKSYETSVLEEQLVNVRIQLERGNQNEH